jgi:hypothetical protein
MWPSHRLHTHTGKARLRCERKQEETAYFLVPGSPRLDSAGCSSGWTWSCQPWRASQRGLTQPEAQHGVLGLPT